MKQQTIIDIMSGRRRGLSSGALRVVLSVLSVPYAAAMCLRRCAYRRGLLDSRRAAVPVICVGNMTTGGTGKTPMTAWIVRRLKEAGRTPAILTRGYRATCGRSDEAELLRRATGVAVVVNPDRVAGAKQAVGGGADVLVMDDGFQHRRLRRDLDIVLIDARNPFGFGWCPPRGLLREPRSALRDAGAIVITHSDQAAGEDLAELRKRLAGRHGDASIHLAVHRPARIIDQHGRELPVEKLAGRKAFAFCGIASPEGFFSLLERLGVRLAGRLALEDHVAYTPEVIDAVRTAAETAEAPLWLTTQKDYVKLTDKTFSATVWQLAVEIDVVEGAEELMRRIDAAVHG